MFPAVAGVYDKFIREVNTNSLARYLLVASAIGSLYKMNASISGAEVGCQGEVGVACSRNGDSVSPNCWAQALLQVCIAAEMGMDITWG
ncbi:L-serine ammonia-lyase, iron-sulfur-dependent, subunit alpha [Shigella flexneri]